MALRISATGKGTPFGMTEGIDVDTGCTTSIPS